MQTISVLIVDDEAPFVRSLVYALKKEGLAPVGVHSCADALEYVSEHRPDVVLVDLRMPEIDGMGTLERLHQAIPDLPVVMISAHGDTRAAVQAVKAGAVDYLTKPFELDDLLHCIRSVMDRQQLSDEVNYHRRRDHTVTGLIGNSPAMVSLSDTIGRVAESSTMRVLIQGESGTGKALVARAIHGGSKRSDGPFIEVNCAALPEQLIEAELFGAEKGAYTGAHQTRRGLVALADGGSLFLDEVGELPLPLQAKLLHFLEDGTYRPVGSSTAYSGDVRVIAATNRDLHALVAEGSFREDLYYRLNVISVTVPALRERGDDVIHLSEHFAARFAAQEGGRPITLSDGAAALLRAYHWPGNVRELKNLIERLTILYPGGRVMPDNLPPELHGAPEDHDGLPAEGSLDAHLERTERSILLDALNRAQGHKGQAAETLGISRHALKRRLKRLGL